MILLLVYCWLFQVNTYDSCNIDEPLINNVVSFSLKNNLYNRNHNIIRLGFTFNNQFINDDSLEVNRNTIVIKQNVETKIGPEFYKRKDIDILLSNLSAIKSDSNLLKLDFVIYDTAGVIRKGYFKISKNDECGVVDSWAIESVE